MRRISMYFLGLTITALVIGLNAGAHDKPAEKAATAPATTATGTKAEFLEEIAYYEQRYVRLAEAIPAEKYAWRPAAGVRSIGELFLHISAANFNIPTMMGATANPATKQKDYEKSMTDKAKIIEQVKQAFANAISVTQAMSNADFAKPEKKLGPDANDGDVIYLMVTHAHEHLGQAIAYARMNGVVPPWTAAAMKKDPKKPQD